MTRFERKLYVDENIVPTVADALSQVFRRDWFGTPVKENLTGGVLDLDLFNHLQALGYSAIITMDAHQLDDPAERAALASCGLHWIGFSMTCLAGAGSNALARQTAMILTGLPYVYDHWASTPTAYLLPSMKAETPAIEPL